MFSEINDFENGRLCPSNLAIPRLHHVVIIECERLGKYKLKLVSKGIAFVSVNTKIHPAINNLRHTDAERSMLPLHFLCAQVNSNYGSSSFMCCLSSPRTNSRHRKLRTMCNVTE